MNSLKVHAVRIPLKFLCSPAKVRTGNTKVWTLDVKDVSTRETVTKKAGTMPSEFDARITDSKPVPPSTCPVLPQKRVRSEDHRP